MFYANLLLASREIVRNIGWIENFCCFLPGATDFRRKDVAAVGVAMSSIFIFELLDKQFENKNEMVDKDKKFEWDYNMAKVAVFSKFAQRFLD
jgi:hypothetical protein